MIELTKLTFMLLFRRWVRFVLAFVFMFILQFQVIGVHAQSFSTAIELTNIAWSPVGGHILAVGSFGLQVFDQKAQLLFGLPDAGLIDAVAWKPNGTQFATGNDDGTINIWDLQTRQILKTLTGHHLSITGLDWSSQNKLASASFDKTVRVWDVTSGQNEQVFVNPEKAWSVAWSRDGQTLAFGGGSDSSNTPHNYIMLWKYGQTNPVAFTPTTGLAGQVLSLSWSSRRH